MKKLFLHIGFNKTGSTSLQHSLFKNAINLESVGYLYPGQATDSYMQSRQHVPLAATLPDRQIAWLRPAKNKVLAQALPDVLTAIRESSAHSVILSSEAFGGINMTLERVRMIQDKLAEFDIYIVAYIRRQDSYILSTYQEGVKNGETNSFQFDRFRKSRQLAFSHRLAPWRQVFGNDRVIVRPFDKSFWPQNELLYDFLTAIGAPYDGIVTLEKPANESIDYRSVELMRQLNLLAARLWPDLPNTKKREFRRNVLRALRASEVGLPDREKMRLSSAQSEELRQFIYDDNALSLAGSGVSPDAFFPKSQADVAARIATDDLDQSVLLRTIASLALPPPKPMADKAGALHRQSRA